jgi:tRNA threonylcarbamoyl adenosine modification protein YeaZ
VSAPVLPSGGTARGRPCLALVTCGPQIEVALSAPGNAVASLVRLGGVAPRSTLLLAAVDLVIEDAGLQPSDLASVVVSRGPGSFTGIRAGLATAAGLAAATAAEVLACDSLLMLAARCTPGVEVWAAQPGRRGEVYARCYRVGDGGPPEPQSAIEILAVAAVAGRGPWVAAEALDIGPVARAVVDRSSAEALLRLAADGSAVEPAEPLYVEGPPIHGLLGER